MTLSFAVFLLISSVFCYCAHAGCGVVSRQQWDGLDPTQVEYLPRPLALVVVQHTATAACETDAACVELLQNIQTNHMDALKYWDIGPNFLIGGNGKVYEGPGWLHVGAHTYGYNRKSIGISFIGNFNAKTPTKAALDAAEALLKCGVREGHLSRSYVVVGHRQLIATESPGRKLYQIIRRWPNYLEDIDKIKNNQ